MSDNPFSEPGDDDRTVIRPMPGGRRTCAGRPLPRHPRRPRPGAERNAGDQRLATGGRGIAAAPTARPTARRAPASGSRRNSTRVPHANFATSSAGHARPVSRWSCCVRRTTRYASALMMSC